MLRHLLLRVGSGPGAFADFAENFLDIPGEFSFADFDGEAADPCKFSLQHGQQVFTLKQIDSQHMGRSLLKSCSELLDLEFQMLNALIQSREGFCGCQVDEEAECSHELG